MERVETLVEKLQQQLSDHASVNQLLLTVHMLQHELVHAKSAELENGSVSIAMPLSVDLQMTNEFEATENKKPIQPEKIIEILQIDEAEVEAELEEIKRKADGRQKIGSHSKPQMLYDTGSEDEIPTLILHNVSASTKVVGKEINEAVAVENTSLNDKLKEVKVEVAERLTDAPVKDIKKAIGVNDRFAFISELFRGDEVMYDRSIKTINSFDIWPEAEYWIRRELKLKLSWQDSNEIVKQFDQVVKRRFS